MAAISRPRVKHLVADANAFFRDVKLHEMAENIYTLPSVLAEIRDTATRQRLQVLPYQIKFRNPTTESIKAVTDFSKKTGDYASLSSVDLSVLGLTYFLEQEVMGNVDHLNHNPKSNRPLINPRRGDITLIGENTIDARPPESSLNQKACTKGSQSPDNFRNEVCATKDTNDRHPQVKIKDVVKHLESTHINGTSTGQDTSITYTTNTELNSNDQSADEGGSVNTDDESEVLDGWITVDNIHEVKRNLEAKTTSYSNADDMPKVACITSDFAMQNVLIQMGLHCLSPEGLCIRRAQTFVLRCFACFKRTSNTECIFCPSCGNKGTLKKVAVEVGEDGKLRMFINFKKPINQRGLRYPLPKFKGGKHANNPILTEYQPRPQNRLPKKALMKVNALDPDFAARDSPFGFNDVQSRAAMLGVRQIGGIKPGLDRDPFMDRKPTGNKKRRKSKI